MDQHQPAAGGVPTATYRLQLTSDFGFDDAARVVPYLHRLGVSHVYLSPILRAAPGSRHGYDVVDPTRVSEELGGEAGLDRLVAVLRAHDMGAIADIVPNHMGLPVPESANPALWSVLREGRGSPYADWFDIAWTAGDGAETPDRLTLPILGREPADCVRDGELRLDTDGDEPVVRYHEHVFPLAPGTAPMAANGGRVDELLARQHYRLTFWRTAAERFGYRRFFDITTLIGVRVERPAVFAATHARLIDLVARGRIDGLRVDHPDGLADPRGYLRALASATGGRWIVAEKILASEERPPADWSCAGTTGYEALHAIDGVLLDGTGFERLLADYRTLTGATGDFAEIAEAGKREAVERIFPGEVTKLAGLAAVALEPGSPPGEHALETLRAAIGALLVACPVYRAYVTPGEPAGTGARRLLGAAAERAAATVPERLVASVALVRDLALGELPARHGAAIIGAASEAPCDDAPNDQPDAAGHGDSGEADGSGDRARAAAEFVVRFQQCSGAVMAKGVEDTAGYRWHPLAALCEVGGDPSDPVVTPTRFHEFCESLAADWPATMTTLATHDAKRSADVRARLLVLAELPERWARAVARWRELAAPHRRPAGLPDVATEYLLWQTLVGCWPIDEARLIGYLRKASREAKTHTSWTDPDPGYEDALCGFAAGVLRDERLRREVSGFIEGIARYAEVNALSQRLAQLTMPGVPDVYQGTEVAARALVDPDNRRPVDFAVRERLLAVVDADLAGIGPTEPRGAAELADTRRIGVVALALRLRREHPAWFGAAAGYAPLQVTGAASEHALAFARGTNVVSVLTRLPVGLERGGGWRDTTLRLPAGRWRDLFTGAVYDADGGLGRLPLARLIRSLPVALLVRNPPERGSSTAGEAERR